MSDKIRFDSKLTSQEIENNFGDFDFFGSLAESLNEAIAYEKGTASAETIARKMALPTIDVAKVRNSLSMTQKSFAALLGVSNRTVEAWECGKSNPTPTAKKLMYLIDKDHSLIELLQTT